MNTDRLHVIEVAALLRQLTAQLIASDDLDDALTRLAASAAELVDGDAWCGVTMVGGDGPVTAAASPGLPTGVDRVQYTIGDGPCLDAIRTRDMILAPDLGAERRWPAWRAAAARGGVSGALCVPIDIDDHVIGALGLYAAAPDRFPPGLQLTTMLVGEHAGLLLAAVRDRSRLTTRADELTAALGDGEAVNRAIGIVMAQRGCTAETALGILTRTAATLRQPLSAVADRLVDTVNSRAGARGGRPVVA